MNESRKTIYSYDENGAPTEISMNGSEIRFTHDALGRLTLVSANHEHQEQYHYDERSGDLDRVTVQSKGARSSFEIENGLPKKIIQFDGGEWEFEYGAASADRSHTTGPSRIRTPDDLDLTYEYDEHGELVGVVVGRSYRIEMLLDAERRLRGLRHAPFN